MNRLAAILLSIAIGFPLTGAAQTYPAKPIRIVVPYPAGGAADVAARLLAQKLKEQLNEAVVIENKGGANGGIGTDFVAKAAPDGYTLLCPGNGPIVVNPSLYASVPYDPLKDLVPVAQMLSYQYVLVVPRKSPFNSLNDLLSKAKSAPGTISYGTSGVGGGNHLAAELLALKTGVVLNHIAYKGSGPALNDLLGGHLSFMFDPVLTSVPRIRTGELRPLAVSSRARAQALPDVPTLEESGLKGYELTQWQGIFAPAGTPRAIVERLNAEVNKALNRPELREKLSGNDIITGSPEQFAKLVREDFAAYSNLIQAAKIPRQ